MSLSILLVIGGLGFATFFLYYFGKQVFSKKRLILVMILWVLLLAVSYIPFFIEGV